jgi:hypothetical protein
MNVQNGRRIISANPISILQEGNGAGAVFLISVFV